MMYHIIEGVRPTKPNFVLTRGYTEELWEMTTSCWIEVATERPTVDHVLEVLEAAAERWKSRYGGSSTLSPTESWSPTLHGEESDSPVISEPEDEPIATDTYSPRGTRSPTIETTPPSLSIPPSPAPPPSAANNETPPKEVLATRGEETGSGHTKSSRGESPGKPPAPLYSDEKVDQLLIKARSLAGGDEARKMAEVLDKVSKRRFPFADRRFKPIGNRCWPISQSLHVRGDGAFKDSRSFARSTVSSPPHT